MIKAQFWSFDVIFAMVVFSVALTILGFTWYNINNQLALGYAGGGTMLQLQTHSLAQNLFSVGSPAGWQSIVNTSNTLSWSSVSIGLASSPASGNLSASKLSTFQSMASSNYQASKQELGVGYDYYVTVRGGQFNVSVGENPAKNSALTIYVERRSGFIQGTPVIVTVEVWTATALAVS